MGTSTANLQLYKPDPTELVDVASHLNANYDRLENKLVTSQAGPCCILRRDTNFTVPNVADTAIPWTVQERNDLVGGIAMWPGNGATGITIRKAGTYTVGMRGVFLGNNAGTIRAGYVVANGGDTGAAVIQNAPAVVIDADQNNYLVNTQYGVPVSCKGTVALNVGDVVKASAYQDSGANLDIKSDVNQYQGRLRMWVVWEPPFIGS